VNDNQNTGRSTTSRSSAAAGVLGPVSAQAYTLYALASPARCADPSAKVARLARPGRSITSVAIGHRPKACRPASMPGTRLARTRRYPHAGMRPQPGSAGNTSQ
jgi:hypothetical protein